MEYVSIPWASHRSGHSDEYETLTANLALWFIHVLAGNRHEVDWKYGPLKDEKVKNCAPARGRKRQCEQADEDAIAFSFSESQRSQQFNTQVLCSLLLHPLHMERTNMWSSVNGRSTIAEYAGPWGRNTGAGW